MQAADHDHVYKVLFSHPRMMRDLLLGFIGGDWLSEVDFGSLERAESAHTSDDLRERRDDIVWRVRWRNRWIYLLVEFQSAIEPFMTVRVLTYIGLLYQDLIRAKEVTTRRALPPVLPIVLYNGASRWRAAEELTSLPYEMPNPIAQLQPTCRYWLIDEGAYDERELVDERNLVAMLFRLERTRCQLKFEQLVLALAKELQGAEYESLRRAFTAWLDRVASLRRYFASSASMSHLLEKPSMLSEFFDEQYRAREQKGMRLGESRVLMRQLRKRFGDLPESVQLRLQTADTDQLEDWCERVLDVTSLRELFPEEHNV